MVKFSRPDNGRREKINFIKSFILMKLSEMPGAGTIKYDNKDLLRSCLSKVIYSDL